MLCNNVGVGVCVVNQAMFHQTDAKTCVQHSSFNFGVVFHFVLALDFIKINKYKLMLIMQSLCTDFKILREVLVYHSMS